MTTPITLIDQRLKELDAAESLALSDSNMKNFTENYTIIRKCTEEKITLLRLAREFRRAGIC